MTKLIKQKSGKRVVILTDNNTLKNNVITFLCKCIHLDCINLDKANLGKARLKELNFTNIVLMNSDIKEL